MKEGQLWDNLRKGNMNALEGIYRAHVQALYDYGIKFTRDDQMVEDCLHELFADIWLKRARLGPTEHVRSYLMLALRRRIYRNLKKGQKTKHEGDYPHFMLECSVDPESALVENEINTERRRKLQQALNTLTNGQREILFLKFERNLSNQEIAELLEMKNQSVRNAIHRSIDKLKKHIFSLFI